MINHFFNGHIPAWIEVTIILFGVFVAAIAAASLTLYKVNVIGEDVQDIKATLTQMPVVLEKLEYLDREVSWLRQHDLEVHHGR